MVYQFPENTQTINPAVREKAIEKFLSFFGTPVITGLKAWNKIDVKDRKAESIKSAVLKNSEAPLSIYFTPNGNHGVNNVNGEPVKFTDKVRKAPYFNTLFVEIDGPNNGTHNSESKTKLYEELKARLEGGKVKPSIINMTGKGVHIYRIIKPEDREKVHKELGKKIFTISKYLTKLLGGDPNAVASQNTNALARVPYMKYWNKKSKKFTCTIDILEYNEGEYVTYEDLKFMIDMIGEQDKVNNTVTKKVKTNFGAEAFTSVNELKFEDILKVLPDRVRDKRRYNLKLEHNKINIVYSDTGEVYSPDGYVYRRAENVVTSFSKQYHSREERPFGVMSNFLFSWFNQDYMKYSRFLKDSFGIATQQVVGGGEYVEHTIEGGDITVEFTEGGVSLVTKKAEKLLFRQRLEILGKGLTKIRADFMESDHAEMAYLVSVADGKPFLIHFTPQKRDFNRAYGSRIFFYGDDNNLGVFFEAIEKADWIPELEVITQSGFYDKNVVIGQDVYYISGDRTFAEQHIVNISDTKHFIGEQKTVSEVIESLCTVFPKEIVYPVVLQTIAMSAMNLRGEKVIYPGLLLTGKSGTGKTTLAEILKQLVGYDRTTRMYNLMGVSPQPLSMYSTDPAILHLEELTGNISKKVEQILRNIINRDRGGRGLGSGNIFYNYKSPLLITGERGALHESLNNRFMMIYLHEKHKVCKDEKKAKRLVSKLYKESASNHVYSTLIENQSKLQSLYTTWNNNISPDFNARNVDVWTYIFVINDIFGMLIDPEELKEIMAKHLKIGGFKKDTNSKPTLAQLQILLLKGLLNKEIHLFRSSATNMYSFILKSPEFWEKNRAKIGFIMAEINEDSGSEKSMITADADSIDIHIEPDPKKRGTMDAAMTNLVNDLLNNLPVKERYVV